MTSQIGLLVLLFLIVFSLKLNEAKEEEFKLKLQEFIKKFKKKEKRARDSKPNILFILSDDHGYRDVGYHGSLFNTTVLDKMAAEGVKLENYYVQPICTPTRSQLLSGRYQIHTGLQHAVLQPTAPACLPTDEITIAQKMKEAGYSTHLIGKWHLGFYNDSCLPTNRGFDTYLGLLLGGGYHFTHSFPTPTYYDFHKNLSAAKEYNGTYSTYAITNRAIDIINNQDGDKPFFMYMSYQAPHAPLEVPEQYKDPYRNIFDDENRLTYAAMVSCLDEGVGNVTATLKAKGLYDNTVIIFSSDNGGSVNDSGNNWPLRGYKLSMFEGGMRAIGFVHSPLLSHHVKGTVSNQLYHVSDWFPTFVEGIAGWNTDGTKPLDGFNQWESIRDGTASCRTELLHNIDPLCVVPGGRDWVHKLSPFNISINAALRHGDWKIVTGDNGKTGWIAPPDTEYKTIPGTTTDQVTWLFNITDDPLEKKDLSDEHRDVLEWMLEKLQKYYLDSVPVIYPATQVLNADPCRNGNDCVWGPWTPT